ncbi:MAG: hypothetical protein ACE5GG_01475 [Candidatus Omnitrophota bacterium]
MDFLVVERKPKNRRKEMVCLYDLMRPMHIPADISVVSKSTFDEWSNVAGSIIYKIKTER